MSTTTEAKAVKGGGGDLAGEMLEAAVRLATATGLAVFPLAGKVPAIAGGHGVKDATVEEAGVRRLWAHPRAAGITGIGVATGEPSGVWVLDVDGEEGEDALRDIYEEVGCAPLSSSLQALTGKGRHIYMSLPEGRNYPKNSVGVKLRGRRIKGLDVRATGGYVVAPPSVHPSGARYAWDMSRDVAAGPAVAPAWLLDLLEGKGVALEEPKGAGAGGAGAASKTPAGGGWGAIGGGSARVVGERARKYAVGALRGICGRLEGAGEGGRHEALNASAYRVGRIVAAGWLGEEEAAGALASAWAALTGGGREREGARTIADGLRAGALAPMTEADIPEREGRGAGAAGLRVVYGGGGGGGEEPPAWMDEIDGVRAEEEGWAPPGGAGGGDGEEDGAAWMDESPPPDGVMGKPVVRMTVDLEGLAARTWEALRESYSDCGEPPLYVQDGKLIRVVMTEFGARTEPVTREVLTWVLGTRICWMKRGKNAEGETVGSMMLMPPKPLVSVLIESPPPSMPTLDSIATAPYLYGGRIVATPGYDKESRVLLLPHRLTDWKRMSTGDALKVIHEWWCDFPFVESCDLAHAIGLALLPFVRRDIDGPVPLHLIEAPREGSGKSLLAEVALYPALGRMVGADKLSSVEEEVEKRIATMLMEGPPAICLDNQRGKIDSPSLEAVLTSNVFKGRLLGSNTRLTLRNRAIWMLTSNNATMTADLARRCVRVRLDHRLESPYERQTWAHADLHRWTADHRGRLASALLSLIAGWLEAGSPAPAVSLASYGAYSRVVGGILAHAGVTGFLGDRAALKASADPEGEEWRAYVEAWAERHRDEIVSASQLRALANDAGMLLEVLGDYGDKSQLIRLGRALERVRERVYAGWRITKKKSGSSGFWKLEPAK